MRHKPIRQWGIAETKTKIFHLLSDGPLQNPRQSFREGHLNFATDKKGKTGWTWKFGILKGVCKTAKCIKECLGEGEQGGTKKVIDKQVYNRCQLHVKHCKSVRLSDQARHLTVCPIFLLNPFLTLFPCNLTLSPVHVSAVKTKCHLLVR